MVIKVLMLNKTCLPIISIHSFNYFSQKYITNPLCLPRDCSLNTQRHLFCTILTLQVLYPQVSPSSNQLSPDLSPFWLSYLRSTLTFSLKGIYLSDFMKQCLSQLFTSVSNTGHHQSHFLSRLMHFSGYIIFTPPNLFLIPALFGSLCYTVFLKIVFPFPYFLQMKM